MILLMAASVCAYFVKGLCGFANTLVFTSILSFGMDNVNISPVELLLGYPSNVIMTWKNRKSLEWKVWAPLAALVLLGNIPGILLLKNADTQSIKIIFGLVVTAIGLEMLLREYSQKKAKESKVVLVMIGIISGVLCGLFGVGALLAAYMSRVTETSKSFKANICVVFIVENTFRIIVYTATEILTLAALKQAVLLIPGMLVGLWLGMRSAGFLNETTVKKIVVVMLIISGIALVVTNL